MKMNLLTELICNVLLYSIGFGGLMVVCAVAEGQLSLLPALAIGAVLCFTFNAVAGVRIATVYKGNIIKNLIMDCQSYTKYRPNETTGGIFVSWRRKEELPTGA